MLLRIEATIEEAGGAAHHQPSDAPNPDKLNGTSSGQSIAFGSANPDDRPKVAALGMEIAALQNKSFMAANMIGSLLRGDLSAQLGKGSQVW